MEADSPIPYLGLITFEVRHANLLRKIHPPHQILKPWILPQRLDPRHHF